MNKYLIWKTSSLFAAIIIFINTAKSVDVTIDFNNQEDFPMEVTFRGSEAIPVAKTRVPAKTTQTINVVRESIMKISARKGSSLELDLRDLQKETSIFHVFVDLKKQVLRVFDNLCTYIHVRPFKPLT